MCNAVCEFAGWLGWLTFVAMFACALGWTQFKQGRDARRQRALEARRERALLDYRNLRLCRAQERRFVEIGSLRERVEILDEPAPPPGTRPGRIKHRNGENVEVDFDTLDALIARAARARRPGARRVLAA